MALFPVVDGKVKFGWTDQSTRVAHNGFIQEGDAAFAANLPVMGDYDMTIVRFSQAVPTDGNGSVVLTDATAGLPEGTQWCNGLPIHTKGLCTSTAPVATYSNGIPMSQLGGICV